ncbi:MAG: PadR family transcriptional regulator [Candidatus Omnitrophica bacterium]|jgi:DNA-binding PadR family transcriptional regulator|nr:PadR family transcriptional regulator [Candidatus Omnitrophota bacterium]MDD5513378.1 PadR family transcriptional regulator [Candidatus Omnitrophota bacterium]
MIEQKLLLLGLLKESPKHGYEIKKKIKEILGIFAGIDVNSVYYPLRVLEKEGLLTKRTSKAGKRPARFVYELTRKGEEHFKELLTRSILDFKRPQFSLDLSLYFLQYLPREVAKLRLRTRIRVLKRLTKGLAQMITSLKKDSPLPLIYILEHNLHMVESELAFLSRLIETF